MIEMITCEVMRPVPLGRLSAIHLPNIKNRLGRSFMTYAMTWMVACEVMLQTSLGRLSPIYLIKIRIKPGRISSG
jgi:hypothetical protein